MVAEGGCSYSHGVFFRISFAHGQLFVLSVCLVLL